MRDLLVRASRQDHVKTSVATNETPAGHGNSTTTAAPHAGSAHRATQAPHTGRLVRLLNTTGDEVSLFTPVLNSGPGRSGGVEVATGSELLWVDLLVNCGGL